MSMDPELRALLRQSVTVKQWTGDNTYGAPQYDSGKAVEARVERRVKLVKNREGRDVIANTVVYLGLASDGTVPVLTPRSSVMLPGSTDPTSILSVEQLPDETGATYTSVVYCG